MPLTRTPKDLGILHVLTLEAVRTHIPRLLRILQSVNSGNTLQPHEIRQLRMALQSMLSIEALIRPNPDYQEYYTRQVSLIHGIISKASDNQLPPGYA